MRTAGGFSLLEVVVAGALLSVGVLALAMTQAHSLHAQRRMGVMREIVRVAEGEYERRLVIGVPGSTHCPLPQSASAWVEACESKVEACAGNPEPCGDRSADRAQRITVRVAGSGGQAFELRGVAARFPPP